LTACPLPDASVDAAVLLNVFEHIEDEAKAMAELYRILKPGGVLVLEVPVGPGLYDVYDELLHHYRRYSMGAFTRLVRGAGFEVAWRSHLGFFLFPAFAAVKLLNRWRFRGGAKLKREKVAAQIAGSRRSGLADAVMRFERALGRRISLPFGIRCLVVARKPTPAVPEKD
jgi:SAM-dependent methyltransferase